MRREPQYYERLRASLEEKLFFLDYNHDMGVKHLVDFGCADGALINALTHSSFDINCLGFDLPEVVKEFRDKAPMTDDPKQVLEFSRKPNSAALFSSSLHEIIEQGDFEDIFYLLKYSDFKYLIIRDMYDYMPVSLEDVFKFTEAMPEYTAEYAKVCDWFNMLKRPKTFMLQSIRPDTIDKECHENYFALNFEYVSRLMSLFPKDYHLRQYIPRFVREHFKKVGYTFPTTTHLQLILKR